MDPKMFDKIKEVQGRHQKDLLKKANVVSVGIGYKTIDGEKTDSLALIVGVSDKLPVAALRVKDQVPSILDDIPVDVMKAGNIKAGLARPSKKAKKAETVIKEVDRYGKYRPAIPGTSIGHKNITAGTFGCVVLKDGMELMLSNNHVFADSNNAEIGDAIFQPGPYDGGTSADEIGVLFDYIPIVFPGGTGGGDSGDNSGCIVSRTIANISNFFARMLGRKSRLAAYNPEAVYNYVDAALSTPTDAVTREINRIGYPAGVAEAVLGMPVQKYGRTTGYTTGNVLQLNVTVSVSYGTNLIATFINQIMVDGSMSEGGDSGSAVLDMNNNVVALLFAGSPDSTILCPIQTVSELLGVEVAV